MQTANKAISSQNEHLLRAYFHAGINGPTESINGSLKNLDDILLLHSNYLS